MQMSNKAKIVGLLLLSNQVLGEIPIKDNQLDQVYEELSSCMSSLGFCVDLSLKTNAADFGIEENYETKDECLDNSMHTWVNIFGNQDGFYKQVLAKDQSLGDSDKDLFLLRRTKRLPVTSGLTKALTDNIASGSYEGYLRCMDREYLYIYGEKKSVYESVGDSFEKIHGFELRGFDAAIPVPQLARLSPRLILLQQQAEQGDASGICSPPMPQDYDHIPAFKFIVEPTICPDEDSMKLQIALVKNQHRSLQATQEKASLMHEKLQAHGRSLLSSTNELKVEAKSANHIVVHGIPAKHSRNLIDQSFQDPEILWVSPKDIITPSNYDANLSIQSGAVRVGDDFTKTDSDKTPFWTRGITGKGQIVAVADSGLDTEHCYFIDENVDTSGPRDEEIVEYKNHRKVISYIPYADKTHDGARDHGTHVAGTVAGNVAPGKEDGISDNIVGHRGVAYDAKLSLFDIGISGEPFLDIPDDIYNDFLQIQYEQGARIQTNSWGTRHGNYYSPTAQQMDEFSFDNQDFIVLVAAGNSRFHKGSIGSLGSPATAKNVVSVGASANTDQSFKDAGVIRDEMYDFSCANYSTSVPCESGIAFFTSNGPAFDGRIKPDIVTPGFFLISAASTTECDVVAFAGTSMATPAAAGSLALARQYFMDGFYPSGKANADDSFVPMGALLKAVLINSAIPMSGSYERDSHPNTLAASAIPNHETGFGLIRLDNTLQLDGHGTPQSVYLDGDFANMPQVNNWKVMEYSFTASQSTEAKITLVWSDAAAMTSAKNAIVNDLDLEVYDANGKLYFPNNRGHRDVENNVEQTVVTLSGSFTVRVVGQIVPVGPQPYALIVRGEDITFNGKEEKALEFEEIVTESSLGYYIAWLFGGVAIGAGAIVSATKFNSKRRVSGADAKEEAVAPSANNAKTTTKQGNNLNAENPLFDQA